MLIIIISMMSVPVSNADLQNFPLINASSIQEAGVRCENLKNGTLKTIDFCTDITVQMVFNSMSHVHTIWNGYYVETDYLENTGCYKRKRPIGGQSLFNSEMSVALCWRFCTQLPLLDRFVIGPSHCHCIVSNHVTELFNKENASLCGYLCNNKDEEYCGSDNEHYNIYKIGIPKSENVNDEMHCKSIRTSTEDIMNVNCTQRLKRKCRSTDVITDDQKSWAISTQTCIDSSNSYLASYEDRNNLRGNHDIWLNDKIYTMTLDTAKGGEKCEIVKRGGKRERINCNNITQAYFLCLTDAEISNGCLYTDYITTAPRNTSIFSLTSLSSSTKNIERSTSSSVVRGLPTSQTISDGAIIGLVIAVCVLLFGGVIFVIFMRRKRAHKKEKDKEDDTYQRSHTVKVKFAKAKGFTNSAYCAEATLDIIHGNPDRNSQDAYMTIADEDLNRNVNGNFHNLQGIPETSPDGMAHTYFTLSPDAAKGSTPVVKNTPSPYDLAKPIALNGHTPTDEPVNRVDGVNTTGPKDVDYDHLSHEAYKDKTQGSGREEENEYSHADIAESNGYSSTNGRKDDDSNPYSHTNRGQTDDLNTQDDNEDYSHVQGGVNSPGGNEEEDVDAYSHAT